jgi:glycosyltransferase involved in cell wall biosynthesis
MAYEAQVARALTLPMYYEVNSPFPEEHLRFHGGAFGTLGRRIERQQRAAARAIFVVSHELRDLLVRDGVPPEKVEVVRNGVDLERFDPTPRGDDGLVRLGFVGSLQAWHGIAELIDMAERVLPAAPNARLEIAGDGPLADWLRARLERSPAAASISWRGRIAIDEVPAFLQRMDVLLAPYPAMEVFYFSPLKLFEYLAAGRAVVASRIGQIRELIEDGRSGILVPPGDVEATSRACLRLIADPALRQSLGEGARVAATSLTWEANARAVLARIAGTLGGEQR